jgi:hypothetical protein
VQDLDSDARIDGGQVDGGRQVDRGLESVGGSRCRDDDDAFASKRGEMPHDLRHARILPVEPCCSHIRLESAGRDESRP